MRTIMHDQDGPVRLKLWVPAGTVTITAAAEFTRAAVALTALTEGDQAGEQAITAATETRRGVHLEVRIPEVTTAAPITTDISGPGVRITGSTVVAGNIGGTGNVGSVSAQFAGGGLPATRAALVQVEARIPAGSRVQIDTPAAAVLIDGPLAVVDVDTQSGAVDIAGARVVSVSTASGAIRVHVPTLGAVDAYSSVGDVHVSTAPGVRAGDITAQSGSGRVRVDIPDDETGTNR
jgi:hypothetical protein